MGVTARGGYSSFAEFEREELRPLQKVGFCLDDLEAEANFRTAREDRRDMGLDELDFG